MTPADATAAGTGAPSGSGGRWLALALLALWAAVIAPWSAAWSAAPEQAYGWGVPALALALAWERRGEKPASGRPASGRGRATATIAALAMLPPALTVLAANPLWPLAQWISVALAITATLALLAMAGGADAVRRWAFPIFFVGTALTWPTAVTVRLVGTLVAFNANLAANLVSALGHPAVVHGNVIELAAGYVGVDEACSGLRSLQTVWMAGWFFGDLFRLRWPRRIVLVIASLAMAVGVNWLRTSALTGIAAAAGVAASEHWHDRAGAAELSVTLALVAAFAWRAARGGGSATASASVAESGPSTLCWQWPAAIALIGAMVAALTPASWYGWHERRAHAAEIQWSLTRPADDWLPVAWPERVRELLQPTSLAGFAHEDGAGRSQAYLVTWEGDVARAAAAEMHDPTICLPAAGVQPRVAGEPVAIDIDGVRVAFTEAAFAAEGREQRIFYCHWDAWLGRARETRPERIADVPAWRLARVLAGRRRGDAAYLVLVAPARDEAEARAWLRRWAPQLYRRR